MTRAALCLLALPLLAQAPAASRVDLLAKEGHWVERAWSDHASLLGQPAPKLEFSGWLNGEVRPEQMKGKIVVVDFWATWCGPCVRAISHNNELLAKYGPKGVLVVGACGSGRDEEKMAAVATEHKLAYPTARVSKATTAAWKVSYWPTYAVLDRQGRIRALGVRPDAVEGILQALLAE